MKKHATLTLSLLTSLTLAACGGGGGSDLPTPPTLPSTPPAAPSLPAAPTPPANSETLPSLTSPQPGSTAADGNGVEGIWTDRTVGHNDTAFIDPNNNLAYLGAFMTVAMNQLVGSIATTNTPNWTMTSGTEFDLPFEYSATAGSGTFAPKQSFTGSYVANGNNKSISLTYDPANALAVTQSSVAGTWAQTGSSITIANDGTVSGTLSNCSATGTLLLSTPNSNKNLYTMKVTVTPAAGCSLQSTTNYSGIAAIVFLPTRVANYYTRTITYVLNSGTTAVAYGQLSKQ